jgi:hypothetical protein
MSEQEEFERLKQEVLKNFGVYMDEIRKASLDDLCDIKKRIQLIDTYTKSARSEISYRQFLNKYKVPLDKFFK